MNKRQETVWEFIGAREFTSTSEIHEYLSGKLHEKVARITVIRDVDFLIRNGLVKSEGQARSIKYSLSNPLGIVRRFV
jgi:arginine repressor